MTVLIHLLTVSLLAPAIGCAACDVFGAWNYGRFQPERIPAAAAGGCIAFFLIWPVTVPLGVGTYFWFRRLSRIACFGLPWWLGSGAAFGMLAGWGLGYDCIHPIVLFVGGVVGSLTGACLRLVWKREAAQSASIAGSSTDC